MTDLHRNSKSDTVLLLDGTGAFDLYVDQGPERTSLDDQTTYIDESPSARAALTAPRNITVKLFMQTGWSGTLIELGDGAAYSWRVSLLGDDLSFAEAGLLRVRVTVPGLSGVSSIVLINWSQRIEDSSVVDEVAVGNLDTGEWAFGRASHAASAVDATDTLTVAAQYGGASPYTGEVGAVLAVQLGRRCHAATEVWEDWGGDPSTPAAFTGYDRTPALSARSDDLRIAGEGDFAGPAFLMAGAATRQAAQRGVGSLVNVNIRSPKTERVAADPVRFYRAAPDGGHWQWCVRYLWHAFVGSKVNVAQVRIHVRAWDVGSDGPTISPVRFRSYSVADLPLGGAPGALTYYRGPIASVTSPSAAGEWVDLGVVRLARDDAGLSYFCLGFLIDEAAGEGDDFDTGWRLNAITVDPFSKNLSGGGFGGDLDKETP